MTKGYFYQLDGLSDEAAERHLCTCITELWRQYKSVRVWCESKAQAERLDEMLWQQPVAAFVPHNLLGEGPAGGAPVELCWPASDPAPSSRRVAVHFNLHQLALAGWQGATCIADRVPADDAGKADARERFKYYRQHGVQLTMVPAPTE